MRNIHDYHMLNKLQKLVNFKIREYKNDKFSELLFSTEMSDSSLWELTNRYKRNEIAIPPMHLGNTLIYSTQEKVNAFANYFQSGQTRNADLGNKGHDIQKCCQ